jgi:hypothetical protein
MTREELIEQYRAKHPTISYGVNDEVFEMSAEDYERTLGEWADAVLAKKAREDEAEAARQAKIAAYEKLGLTAEEIEALLPKSLPLRPAAEQAQA